MEASPYEYKVASEDWEFEAVHRLNYKTFVEEIPQHRKNDSGLLVDKFHSENTYFICLHEKKLVGMICARRNRPFSLDSKLDDLDSYLKIPKNAAAELRLLAVEKEYRLNDIFWGLGEQIFPYLITHRIRLLLVTAVLKNQRLYEKVGFKPFGPQVVENKVIFQPMFSGTDDYKNNNMLHLMSENFFKNL